ncbi:SIS domain-containing protein [Candidatus Parcubacteria bacterium]|nr:MAG: SIS domain-containing protein [Candidatus Parcubacteria bacterium]
MSGNQDFNLKYDREDIAFCLKSMPEQVSRIWLNDGDNIPATFQKIENIVVAGMGGSSLAGHFIQSVGADFLKKPLFLQRDYKLPAWVDKKTLLIAVSFSGNTEETLEMVKDGLAKKAKVLIIAGGGKLERIAKKHKLPAFIFETQDLAKKPRFGLGFMIGALMLVLKQLKVLTVTKKAVKEMVEAMNEVIDTCILDVEERDNPAKAVAREMLGKTVLLIGAEHLVGCSHIVSNQINETGKQFACYLSVPELNHHFLESLSFPKNEASRLVALIFNSDLYNKRNQKRINLTAEFLEKQGVQVIEYKTYGKTVWEEGAEILQFGAFAAYYLALLNKVDPADIPIVDWFKRKMS